MELNKIICGSALEALKNLPAESISCCISSPPYWALRDYGVTGQLGLEKTFEEYIDKLCTIYDEVRRVLRKDGCCFVNLGDTYSSGNYEGSVPESPGVGAKQAMPYKSIKNDIPTKSLCLIPQRFAIEMVNRGWILRNTIIWHKPNPMPSSAKDRFTVDFEYVYFFVKSKKYWFEPQYEPHKEPWRGQGESEKNDFAYGEDRNSQEFVRQYNPLGRNKRCVWTMSRLEWLEWCDSMWVQAAKTGALWKIPTQPFPEAHFATYPEKLVEPMIKAGCPEFICTKCGKAREKVWDVKYLRRDELPVNDPEYRPNITKTRFNRFDNSKKTEMDFKWKRKVIDGYIGYTDCNCGAEFKPGVILDPFGGAMTTALIAYKLKRNYLAIELKPKYCEMGKARLKKEADKYGLFENNPCIGE